jgi:hypothetical protein
MRLLVYLVLSAILVIVGAGTARASGWTDASPRVVINEVSPYASQTYCPTFYQKVDVFGEGEYDACVFVGAKLTLANYKVSNLPRVAVKLPYNDQYYRVHGVCEHYWGCVYSDIGDVLVEHQLLNGKVAPVVYGSARSRLQVSFPLSYEFDKSDAGIPFQGIAVPKFGLSNNGRWLAGELKGHGVGLADLQEKVTHTLDVTGNLYGRGFDPQMELAVSNDGRGIVAVGLNVGVKLYDATPECLQHQDCQSSDAGVGGMLPAFRSAHLPRFDESGQLLKMALVSRTVPSRVAILGKAGTENRREYMALGDSFTSGEGEVDEQYYEPLSNTPDNACHISRRSYPYLLGVPLTQNVACAGTTIAGVLTEAMYPDEGDVLIEPTAGTKPQAMFLERAQPRLATVGIGGNDAGLMAKLKTCAMPGSCHWVGPEGLGATVKEIAFLFGRLVEMYRADY